MVLKIAIRGRIRRFFMTRLWLAASGVCSSITELQVMRDMQAIIDMQVMKDVQANTDLQAKTVYAGHEGVADHNAPQTGSDQGSA